MVKKIGRIVFFLFVWSSIFGLFVWSAYTTLVPLIADQEGLNLSILGLIHLMGLLGGWGALLAFIAAGGYIIFIGTRHACEWALPE